MENIRIDLGEGKWWEVRGEMTIGIQKASEVFSLPYINPELSIEEQMKAIPLGVRVEMNRAMVLKGTVDWSYGPVTKEIFENEIPASDYDIVLGRCNELYSSIPLTRAVVD